MSLKNLFGRKNKQESKNANTKKTTITDNNDVDSEKEDNTKVGVFADAKDFSTTATPSVEMTEEVEKKDNTKVGVFADAKDFSTLLEMTAVL
jgi:hypothetical protein